MHRNYCVKIQSRFKYKYVPGRYGSAPNGEDKGHGRKALWGSCEALRLRRWLAACSSRTSHTKASGSHKGWLQVQNKNLFLPE